MRKFLQLSLVLTVICAVSATALALTYGKTSPIVEERRRAEILDMLKDVLPGGQYEEVKTGAVTYYKAVADGTLLGVAFPTSANGYGGPVRLLVVFSPQGTIKSVRVMGHLETPGFGDRIVTEPWFVKQFEGKSIADSLTIGNDIDGLTGATVTSKATAKAVRQGVQYFKEYFSGGDDR